MKTRAVLVTGMGVLILLSCLASAMAAERTMAVKMSGGEARVSVLIGNARMISADARSTRPLSTGDRLHGGDEVTTGPGSRLELILPDSSRVRFNENTRFRIQEVHYGGENSSRNVRINVTLGKAWANVVRAAGSKGRFELQCENAVAGVRGTIYRMDVENDRSALVKVYEGQVQVSGGGKPEAAAAVPAAVEAPSRVAGPRPVPGPKKVSMEEWTVIVRAMQQIRINADGTAGQPSSFRVDEDRDEWVNWNRSRDENAVE